MTVEGNNNIDRSHYIVIRCIARQKSIKKRGNHFRILKKNITIIESKTSFINFFLLSETYLVSKESILRDWSRKYDNFCLGRQLQNQS